jgi:hypothetical protein
MRNAETGYFRAQVEVKIDCQEVAGLLPHLKKTL